MYTVKELIETLKQCPEDYAVQIFKTDVANIEEVGIDHGDQTVCFFAEE